MVKMNNSGDNDAEWDALKEHIQFQQQVQQGGAVPFYKKLLREVFSGTGRSNTDRHVAEAETSGRQSLHSTDDDPVDEQTQQLLDSAVPVIKSQIEQADVTAALPELAAYEAAKEQVPEQPEKTMVPEVALTMFESTISYIEGLHKVITNMLSRPAEEKEKLYSEISEVLLAFKKYWQNLDEAGKEKYPFALYKEYEAMAGDEIIRLLKKQ